MKVVRSYKLRLYGNAAKVDTARYTHRRFNQYCNMFLGRIFFGERRISTAGTDGIVNLAQHRSYMVIRAMKAASRKLGTKINVPFARNFGLPVKLEVSKATFDYWVMVPNMWRSAKPVYLPAKSHKALNAALRSGWELSKYADLRFFEGKPYAIVYVSKEAPRLEKHTGYVGCDVGYKYGLVTSDGHIGRNVAKVIRRTRLIRAERQRQKHKISAKVKTTIKQILDIEAKRLLGRSEGMALVVESPKRLANLSCGKLQGWSRSYFANRLGVLCKERGVKLIEVSPYQTSVTCSGCQAIDKQSRVTRDRFECTACGFKLHADLNAARNVAQKGTRSIRTRKISEEGCS